MMSAIFASFLSVVTQVSPEAIPAPNRVWLEETTIIDPSQVIYDSWSPNGTTFLVVAPRPLRVSSRGKWLTIPADHTLSFFASDTPVGAARRNVVFGTSISGLMLMSEHASLRLAGESALFLLPVSATLSRPQDHGFISQGTPSFVNEVPSTTVPEFAIDTDALSRTLEILVGHTPTTMGTEEVILTNRSTEIGRKNTAEFLKQQMDNLGLETRMRCYEFPVYGRKRTGCNVEGTLWGTDIDHVTLFTGHFDSVTVSAADDNGSGTSALLEIARLVVEQPPQSSIRFVFFDQEESGLIGSRAYLDNYDFATEAAIDAVYNLDMIGYDSDDDGALHIIDCNKGRSPQLSQRVVAMRESLNIRLQRADACTNRSDHGSFWNKNIPAIIVSENFFNGDGNSCYHRACDTIDNMNIGYFQRITTLMAGVALSL